MTSAVPTASADLEQVVAIAHQFNHPGIITHVVPFGNGNINDTFLVNLTPAVVNTSPTQPSATPSCFVLQRINRKVFSQPELVMQNMRCLAEHVQQRLGRESLSVHWPGRRWETPDVVSTHADQDFYIDSQGDYWRGISFIENAITLDTIETTAQAKEVGLGLGMFHTLVSDLPVHTLADTLAGFHIAPRYLQQYDNIRAVSVVKSSPEVKYGLQLIEQRRAWIPILEIAKAEKQLPMRLMHGDPKANNFLFDADTYQTISLIDLDTVKPGLIHYDIGDCLRSACNPMGEETQQWESISFDLDLCQAILGSYLSVAGRFLTENDYAYCYDAIRLIAFELGLRFFTDYLAGNPYFKVRYPEHNLMRALVQFKLTESIEAQESSIRRLIQSGPVLI
jgi:Phosphotransferase enzyme family